MKMSDQGLAVLKFFERCRLTAYPDPASKTGEPWSIAYGDTGPDVVRGLCIDQANADARLALRLSREFEPGVMRLLSVIPDQGQFDGFVDFAYNEGLGNFAKSNLLARFNNFEFAGCADEFLKWDMAAGREMLGLERRRIADQALYRGASALDAIAKAEAVSSL